MATDNPFLRFWSAGYRRLVPITPPGADVSEQSTLAQRRGSLGKAPGIRGGDGLWRGFDWLKHVTTAEDLEKWAAMGAGVGIRTGAGLIALDIDTLDKDLADRCATTATAVLKASENRVGHPPKRLKLYRVTEDVPYRRLRFAGGHVEILSEGRQFVAHGLHPTANRMYEWPRGLPRFDDLPIVTPAQLDEYFERLAKVMPEATVEQEAAPAERAKVDQDQLTGRAEDVARAVAALPNTSALFPRYDDYIRVGYAIKGATQDDPELGLELFQEWASRWDGGTNDPAVVAADWRRMKPPYSVGAQYLFHLAEKHGSGQFQAAEAWFTGKDATTGPIDLNPFESQEQAAREAEPAATVEPLAWQDPADWQGLEPPPREWEVEGWIPRYEVTLLYGEGGVGKTLIAQQYATAAAAGVPWLAQATRPAKVMCMFCEDSPEELHRRQLDICRALKIEPAALRGRLRIASRKYADNLLAVWNRAGEMRRTAVWEMLRADALAWGADVIIIDTVADTFGGSEIDRSQVNAFVKSCLGRLAQEIGGSVIALAHPSVGGRQEGRSGSTAWANASRSRLYLQYPKGKEEGSWRELVSTKSNYGPKGAQIRLKWAAGAFEAVAVRGVAPSPTDLNAFKTAAERQAAAPAALPSIDDVAQAAVLRVLALAEEERLPLSLSPRAATYAPRVLKAAYGDALAMLRAEDVADAIEGLQRAGHVRVAAWRTEGTRSPRIGFAVVSPGTAAGSGVLG